MCDKNDKRVGLLQNVMNFANVNIMKFIWDCDTLEIALEMKFWGLISCYGDLTSEMLGNN